MHLRLHECARTTPAVREELRTATGTDGELARRYNVSRMSVRKWRTRGGNADRSHCPQRLQTTRSAAQEVIVVALRQTLQPPLDDLVAVTRDFIHEGATRSGVDRCLRRHGVSNPNVLLPKEDTPKVKAFKDYKPGLLHVDLKYLPQMLDEERRRYLFVAIDRATRWVDVEILPEKSAACARGFLDRLLAAAPFRVTKILTDNGKEFTDRFCASGERAATGQHPQTNGMVERFNGRISDVLATHRFRSGEHLADTLTRYVNTYNHYIPQRALGHISPLDALREWYHRKPELFVLDVTQLPGTDM